MNPQNDIEIGRTAMIYFHNRAALYSGYNITLDQLIDQVGGKRPEIFLDGLGMTILNLEMRDGQIKDAMVSLADTTKGMIPKNNTIFFQALSNRLTNVTVSDWVVASPEIAGNIAKDLGQGAVEIGNTVITTGKGILAIAPVLIIAAGVFIFYSRTRQIAGK